MLLNSGVHLQLLLLKVYGIGRCCENMLSSCLSLLCNDGRKELPPRWDRTVYPGSSRHPVGSLCSFEDQSSVGRPTSIPPQAVMVDLCADHLPVKMRESMISHLL